MQIQKNILSKWLWLIAVTGMSAGFVLLVSEIQEAHQGQVETITSIDNFIHQDFINIRTSLLDTIAKNLTALGSVTFLVFLVIILGLIFIKTKRLAEALQLFTAATGAAAFTFLLKSITKIPRPDEMNRLVQSIGYSFPSGHTLSASSIYLTVAFLLSRILKNPHRSNLITATLVFLILSIGISRIYLGVHYFSDMIGGLLVGISWAIFLNQFPSFFNDQSE